jgi:thiol:disulfide interchange protein DsbD
LHQVFEVLEMRLARLIFAMVLLFVAGVPVFAASNFADVPHLHVQLVVPNEQLHPGVPNNAGLYFKLEPGWHVYWKNAGDSGEPPRIQWTLPAGISAGPLEFPPPKRLPLGPLMDFGYENEVLFPLNLNVPNSARPGQAVLNAKVSWLVCREVCIPGKAELEAQRTIVAKGQRASEIDPDRAIWNRLGNNLPTSLPRNAKAIFQSTTSGFRLAVQTGQQETSAEFFPADLGILDNPAPQKLTPTPKGLVLDLKKDANLSTAPAQLKGVLELSGGRAFDVVAVPGVVPGVPNAPVQAVANAAAAAPERSSPSATLNSVTPAAQSTAPGLIEVSALAFLGRLLLNLMPCVFPVLFIKGLALVQSGNEEKRKLRAHGFVYAAGILVSFWVLVGMLLSLRAAGAHLGWGFQFQSPVFLTLMAGLLFFLGLSLAGQFEIGLSLTGKGGSLAAKQGYTGSFFTGVLAVIVATPCTAPFMGAAVGYALAQSPAVTFAVFTALALGLAAPYVALTLQPAWTRLLPRPGAWMEVLKQATAVPIFATVIWLAWVLAQAYGAAMLAALLASLLLLAVAGWFLGRWPAKHWAMAVAGAIVLCVVAVSVIAQDNLIVPTSAATPSSIHGAWEPWTANAVARYRAEGRPVFVDFTANWCLSCQVNERVALNQPEVQKAFTDANVALLRADWTQHDEAIAQALTALGRNGVPAYVLYAPGESNPRLLPEVLTPGIVTDALGKLPRTATQATATTSNLK